MEDGGGRFIIGAGDEVNDETGDKDNEEGGWQGKGHEDGNHPFIEVPDLAGPFLGGGQGKFGEDDLGRGIGGDVDKTVDPGGCIIISDGTGRFKNGGGHILIEAREDVGDEAGAENKTAITEDLFDPDQLRIEAIEQVSSAVEKDHCRSQDDADGLVYRQVGKRKRCPGDEMEKYDDEEDGLTDEVTGEIPFEIEVGLLDGFEMREQGHTEQAGDIPFQHGHELGADVQDIADPGRTEEDQDNENHVDHKVDDEGGGGDGRFLGAFDIRADELDVGVLQQAAFRCLEDSDGREKDSPCAIT